MNARQNVDAATLGSAEQGSQIAPARLPYRQTTQEKVTFEVRGIPQTQGSMKAFMPKGARFPIVTHQKGAALMSWRGLVAGEAARAAPPVPWNTAVRMDILFLLQRPKAHYKPNTGVLRKSAPDYPAGCKHDLDKLVRAVLDALTGIFYRDDGQVCEIVARKVYGAAGAVITLEKMQ